MAALLCAGCEDVHDERDLGDWGREDRRRRVDNFLGIYTVKFDLNSSGYSTGGTVPPDMPVIAGDSITLPNGDDLTRSGYVFGGWNTSSSGGTNYSAGSSYKPTGSVTLYARWIGLYKVEFSGYSTYYGGGSGTAPATIYVMPGDSITLPGGDSLTRSGYYFDGWSTSSYSSGTNYSAGSTYKPTGSITMYARWVSLFMVTFYANGGDGTVPEAIGVIPGDSITLPGGDNLTMSGYYFGGWNTNDYGTVTNYSAGSFYKPDGSVTLYAKWNPIPTITFSPDGGTVSPTSSVTGADGTLDSLPVPTRKNANYTFIGWYTEAIGGTEVTVNTVFNYNTTIYARWNHKNVETFIDDRDDKIYKKTAIGTQTWMAENLNFDVTGSVCNGGNDDNCAKYGRLYSWFMAMRGAESSSASPSGVQGVCPKGWHIPSDSEWTTLTDYLGGSSIAGTELKSASGWNGGTNNDTYGFSALPGGYGFSGGGFFNAGNNGYWWSATEYNPIEAWGREMYYLNEEVGWSHYIKADLFSVRCVQNE